MEIAGISTSDAQTSEFDLLEVVRKRCASELNVSDLYDILAENGNQWGPTFRGTERVWVGENESIAQIQAPTLIDGERARYIFHPALGDACGHALIMMMPISSVSAGIVGEGIDEIRFYQSPRGRKLWSLARIRSGNDGRVNTIAGDIRIYDDTGILLSELLGVRIRRLDNSTENHRNVEDWFYTVRWQPEPSTGARNHDVAAGPWLVFADQRGVAEQIAALRHQSGRRTILVSSGEKWSFEGDRAIVCNDTPEDYRRLLDAVSNPAAVVNLWSLDVTAVSDPITEALRLGTETTLNVVRALQTPDRPRPRIWLVTSDSQPVTHNDKCEAPWGAHLWGLGASLSAEQPHLWGGLVDLTRHLPAELSAAHLVNEIERRSNEDKVAFRDSQRYVSRLIRRSPTADFVGEFTARSDLTYVIAGGLGGIGSAIAHWLVERGARHLLLLGRTPLPSRKNWSGLDPASKLGRRTRAVTSLEKLGAEVEIAAVDIAIDGELENYLLSRRARGAPAVCAVVHAVGELRLQELVKEDGASIRANITGKTRGAWRLHRLFLNEPLDFFVLCSSSSSLLKSPLLGGYAAGNAFLDALAHHRRGFGIHALSINWGTWGEVGMAMEPESQRTKSSLAKGMGVISNQQGITALNELLQCGDTQTGVMPINWPTFFHAYPVFLDDPFFRLISNEVRETKKRPVGLNNPLSPALTLNSREPKEIAQYLAAEAARVLGMLQERIDKDVPLSSYGFDSFMAVQLKNQIEADFGAAVPLIQFLQGASIDQIFSKILDALQRAPLEPTTVEDRRVESGKRERCERSRSNKPREGCWGRTLGGRRTIALSCTGWVAER